MISVITTSSMEAEVYAFSSQMNNAIDAVGNLINDMTADGDEKLEILVTIVDPEKPEEFGLAFSGSTLSLEFSKDAIDLVDFNEGDEIVLETFGPTESSKAALCLYNRLTA